MTNAIICAIIVIWETALGCAMLVRCYPERRFHTSAARVVEYICFLLICGLYTCNAVLCFVSNLMAVFIGIICSIYIFTFYHCRYRVSLAWMEFYFILMSLLRMPYIVGRGIWLESGVYFANIGKKPWSGFLYEVILLSLMSFFYFFLWKGHSVVIQKILRKYWVIFAGLAIAAWELMSSALFMEEKKFTESTVLYLMWGCVGLFLAMICLVMYWMYRNEKNEKKLLSLQQAMLVEKQREQKELYEEHEQRMHDMKHVLLFLQHCIEEGTYEKALQKIANWQEQVQGKKVWTGNTDVDFVLNSKWRRMEELEITFQLETDFFEIPLDELDFSIILGTLLDNAIEAAQQCEKGQRKIFLKLKGLNKMFGMTLWNTSSRRPKTQKGKIQTTKPDAHLHGWGLASVRGLVEKHDGEICFRYDEQFFEVKIMFTGGGKENE